MKRSDNEDYLANISDQILYFLHFFLVLLKHQRINYKIIVVIGIKSFLSFTTVSTRHSNWLAKLDLWFAATLMQQVMPPNGLDESHRKRHPTYINSKPNIIIWIDSKLSSPKQIFLDLCSFNFPKTIRFSSRSQHSPLDAVGKSERTNFSRQTKQTFVILIKTLSDGSVIKFEDIVV